MTKHLNTRRRLLGCAAGFGLFLLALNRAALAATFTVEVGPGGAIVFSPSVVSIQPGDTVKWDWKSSMHSVTSGPPGGFTGLFDSGVLGNGSTFSFTFPNSGTFTYHCTPHGAFGMTGVVVVAGATPTPTPIAQSLNVSTRLQVGTGDNVMIGGFIITDNTVNGPIGPANVTAGAPKKILLRAIGPSLADAHPPVPGAMADPVLELHAGDGSLITTNDNWKLRSDGTSQQAEIEATTVPPTNDLESALIATLNPGNYTAIVSGKNNGTGVGLVEVYDLDQAAPSQLANISTRGFVGTDSDVLIGGFILGPASAQDAPILARAIGPSLLNANPPVPDALANPVLDLRDVNGNLLVTNDNWKLRSDGTSQQAEIEATTVPPTNDLESATLATLPPGNYTVIVSGKNAGTGVALVEIYRLSQ